MAVQQMLQLQCMEVWGGNGRVDSAVAMAGMDAWIYSLPHGQADGGGDVYYFSACATGRINRLLLADVAGHGASVAETAVALRGLMRQHINYHDQSAFLKAMNRQFAALARHGLFATSIATTFFAPTNHLSLCNAGHPPPLLYRAAAGEWSYLEHDTAPSEHPANIPLGILDLSEYEQFDVPLDAGDLVLCYTDLLIESLNGDGQWLGRKGLLEIVRELDVADPASVIPNLLRAIEAQADGNLGHDDVTVLLFRPNGHGDVPLRDRLLAPVRVLRAYLNGQ